MTDTRIAHDVTDLGLAAEGCAGSSGPSARCPSCA
jgi:hypothetical protein